MRATTHSPSDYQFKIRGGQLSEDDINLGLQSKCLNETYLYDKHINSFLLPIGTTLFEIYNRINKTVDNLFTFSANLTTSEILLLEQIRKQFQEYQFNSNAGTEVSGVRFYPVNPSMAYMANNLSQLYVFFKELQVKVFQNKFTKRNIVLHKVQFLYYSNQFKKCNKWIRRVKKKYPKEAEFLKFYEICSYLKNGQFEISYNQFNILTDSKPNLVTNRNFIADLISNAEFYKLIKTKYSEANVSQLSNLLESEKLRRELFVNTCTQLKQYYSDKAESSKKGKT